MYVKEKCLQSEHLLAVNRLALSLHTLLFTFMQRFDLMNKAINKKAQKVTGEADSLLARRQTLSLQVASF